MQSINHLVEQSILESQSRLRHIDELVAGASHPASGSSTDPEVQALLGQVRTKRARLGKELEDLRGGFVNGSDTSVVERGEGLKSALQSVGLQFERALAAIFDSRGM